MSLSTSGVSFRWRHITGSESWRESLIERQHTRQEERHESIHADGR